MHASLVLVACLAAAPCLGQRGFDHMDLDAHAKQELGHHHPILKSGSPEWGYDIHYHRLEIDLDPDVNAISGTVTTYFSATEDLDLLRFDASELLSIDQVLHHGNAITYSQVSDDLLVIELPSTLAPGQLDSVTVSYSGSPAGSGLGSFVLDVHDGIPVLWTLSEPYGAKDWWPCKQDLNDKIDSLDLLVTTTSAYRAAGNGVLINELVNGGQTTYHWRHRHPIAYYLIATAVTNYEVSTFDIELPGATVPMVVYSYPEDAFFMELNAGDVLQQMPLFSELFGLYPYADEKYGHAQFSWGGGMEHQTMSFMGYFSYELAAHELAHQWFGDKVTCGSWEDLWLNEGFATYLTGLCYDFIATQYWAGWKQGSVDYITSQPDGSVFCPDTNDLDRLFDPRLTYRKGALVLHMLRWVCGDSAFFAGCRNYLDDPALQLVGAHTSDLQQHLEAASGLDLNEFLADWFVGEGYPSYTVEWTQDNDGNVTLVLDQTTSHPSVDFFEMPVPIRFKNNLDDSTIVLDHTFSGQEFSFHIPFEADSALFDPETWLISRENLVVAAPGGLRADGHALIYPVPTQDQVTILVGTLFTGNVAIRIYDTAGRMVMGQSAAVHGQRISLDLSGLGAGWYMVELRNAERAVQLRFVKE